MSCLRHVLALDPAVHGMGPPKGDCWRSNKNRHSPTGTETQRNFHIRSVSFAQLKHRSHHYPPYPEVSPQKQAYREQLGACIQCQNCGDDDTRPTISPRGLMNVVGDGRTHWDLYSGMLLFENAPLGRR